MITKLFCCALSAITLFASCSSKPSHADIEKKLLMEYVCAETAKVNGLHIDDTKDAESIIGLKGFQYTVSGEVEWKAGCSDYGTRIQPGFTEKFENKTVTLIKTDDGWQ